MPVDEKLSFVAKKVTDGVDGILSQERRENRGERRWDLVLGPKGKLASLPAADRQVVMPRCASTSPLMRRRSPSSRSSRTSRRNTGTSTFRPARL